jgi:hypothetical protein
MFPVRYTNTWNDPSQDERWEGLLHIAEAIHSTHAALKAGAQIQLTGLVGTLEAGQVLSPLELAALLQRAAERIQEMTRTEGY